MLSHGPSYLWTNVTKIEAQRIEVWEVAQMTHVCDNQAAPYCLRSNISWWPNTISYICDKLGAYDL